MSNFTLTWDQPPTAACRGGALAIGNFDGVHRGHLALLSALRRKAEALPGPAVALTFNPHPLQLLRPEQFQPVLTTVADRAVLLQENGADHVVILHTTPAVLQLTAAEFFDRVLLEQLGVRAVVEGPNFRFGHNREGGVETLAALSRRAGLEPPVIVPALQLEGVPVSSSRVRNALVQGNVHEAAVLLGRNYRTRGLVGTGQRRGQTLGFPTANLEQLATLIPGDGVYAVRVPWAGRLWPGAANVGPNPTFGERARKVEVHLIGFHGDLYGQELVVEFVERLRDTRPFSGPEQLTAQLRQDVERARQLAGEKVR
jgi:riboflavin kinase/FMN adenylyltransferase